MSLYKLYGVWNESRLYIDWFHIHSGYLEKSELKTSEMSITQLAVL